MKRRTERKVAGFLRVALVVVVVLLQLLLLLALVRWLHSDAIWVYAIIEALAVIEILVLVSRNRNSAYTVAWVLILALLPVFGQILYVLWGRSDTKGLRNERHRSSIEAGNAFLQQDEAAKAALAKQHPDRQLLSNYLARKDFPLYQNTDCRYYPSGEAQFDAMLADMEKAEKFIFLEYFILNTGVLWDRFYDVLTRKAAEGVEVRLMFDDFGSIITAPDNLIRDLESHGIKAVRFNPIHKFISRLYINFRDHRKVTVIDGNIGYTGGTNIADEYINEVDRWGHWKDTGIRLTGDAVFGFTVSFLQVWDGETNTRSDYNAYRPTIKGEGQGFFQPFGDSPVNNPDNPAEIMYRNMITNARDYLYISTPYLVIDETMTDMLCTAALSGVDVRLVTPYICDHWYVHAVTRSNYARLMDAGVRVYEYKPGYIHAKTLLSDDDHAITGSINMDYRSFNLHFENGVWICGAPVLADIKQDFADIFAVSEEIDPAAWRKRPALVRIGQGLLRIFAILM